MNLDALGNIGEFVGSLGVVVSLIYLAVQVRQNTKSNYAASVDRISSDLQEFTLGILRDEKTNRLLSTYILNHTPAPDISEQDQFDVGVILLAAFMVLWRAYDKNKRGQVEGDAWNTVLTLFRNAYFPSPVVNEWFSGPQAALFPDDFRQFVSEEMKNISAV